MGPYILHLSPPDASDFSSKWLKSLQIISMEWGREFELQINTRSSIRRDPCRPRQDLQDASPKELRSEWCRWISSESEREEVCAAALFSSFARLWGVSTPLNSNGLWLF